LLLRRGQVGTVVMNYPDGAYEVEFADRDGRAFAILSLRGERLMVLHDTPISLPRRDREGSRIRLLIVTSSFFPSSRTGIFEFNSTIFDRDRRAVVQGADLGPENFPRRSVLDPIFKRV
jgi:hypothetical protein